MSAQGITALLGPTNTGKTHRAVERMLEHRSGMIGLPLRLLAREIYDRITPRVGEQAVALVTGEEKRVPPRPRYWVCTVESMPVLRDVDFVAVDEIQLAAHPQRGHTFTQRLLRARGELETWFLGSESMRPMVEALLPTARLQTHPRYSQLSYAGTLSLGALPPRTAVVAFSVADVYDLAERLRQRHGGTAVVTGSLSPRTRNAQVAMYQSGEVDYMVATDAIGMGLNLEVDRVVFAALHKFDGSEVRALEPAELAQIAGRAGRYTSDGAFATLRPLPGLEPRVAAAIEQHQFPPLHRLVWRNDELDFDSVEALLASLRARPPRRALRLVERADDFEALQQLLRNPEIRARAQGRAAVELLWEVCRIPDYRKLLLESHVQLLAALFVQLHDAGRIDAGWMGQRVRALGVVEGDIDTLTGRIASIRTWTYVAHHERWVDDAPAWQQLAREIEDRCSDALHQRLTDRFVARQQGGRPPQPRPRRPPGATAAAASGPGLDGPFAQLRSLRLPAGPGDAPGDDDDDWLEAALDAAHPQIGLDEGGRLVHDGRVLAVLARGSGVLHPELRLSSSSAEGVGAGARLRLTRRLQAWLKDAIAELLAPLAAIDGAALGPSARGLLYQLEQGLGTLDGDAARTQLERLRDEDRERFAAAGVTVAHEVVHVARMATPAALRLRTALVRAAASERGRLALPEAREVSWAVEALPPPLRVWLPFVGYVVRGPRAIRADVLARVGDELARWDERTSLDEAALAQLGARLATRRRELPAVLRALGLRLCGARLTRARER